MKLKSWIQSALLVTVCSLGAQTPVMAEDDVDSADSDGQFIKRTTDKDYDETIRAFKNAPKSAAFFDHAYGYAIFPVVGKVGFVIGGAYGEGRVYKQGNFTGMTKLTQASLGFQFGGQAYSEIIFFQDQRAYDEFVSGSFEFGAQASAVVITAGVSGEASTKGTSATANAGDKYVAADGQYYKGMAVFNLVKAGLMYEAAISGQKFSFDPAH
ncbi:YSC84-related protein [Thiomicrorhabdus sp. 6S3-12]|uniref:lipid-binding SYLF domain-containing protein n=1 Tax=Thiomicrorhabdus sp. 6S3-12 TaxID=2819681 RepID=UPI001AAC96D9|nr:lipid-binding SYLF domain-containing protein [Thiomicrorhabdus sp. 6S3-12]MBO1923701.1 lipid-binding SYLF domain-containing protein [Thiomicrorhabdus sp. 6S3-12]